MLFDLRAVPTVNAERQANEFFLSISKVELFSQHEKDHEQFCVTVSYALTMLCAPHSFSHNMDDEAIADLLTYAQSDTDVTGIALVVEYQQGQPRLTIGLEY